MANADHRLDEARGRVLDRMENGQRLITWATAAAGVLELGMLVACILLVDWGDRTQVLLFLIFILSYFILVLCVLALAGHVTRSTARVLAALEARQGSETERVARV
jgi:fatty acid desaturase